MKALVLTYDKNIDICSHMVHCYHKVWSKHPFTFRIPYQKYPDFLKNKYGSTIELVHTPKDIKSTVQHLLEDIPDNEWVYWCMDDYYLIDIKQKQVKEIYQWIADIKDTSISGISFLRSAALSQAVNLKLDSKIISPERQVFIERKNYKRIWNPQFMRAKVLKSLFTRFPDENFRAHQMDDLKDALQIPSDQKIYVSEKNLAIFGESTRHGKLTINCVESMEKNQFLIPEEWEIYKKNSIFQGRFLPKRFDWIRNFQNKYF